MCFIRESKSMNPTSCKIIIYCLCAFFFSSLSASIPAFEDQDIAKVLNKHGVKGTVIISSLDQNTTYIYNSKRANKRLCPASTFKIANSIIAIEEDLLKDQYEMIKWDGQTRFLDAWNQDQNLNSAFRSSCVWFYQELAKKVKRESYLKYFNLFNYGNCDAGQDITNFWLDGNLKITPLEQIEFLRKICTREFPISTRAYDILQDIMLEETSPSYQIFSKTGAACKDWVGHGWYVGYVASKENTYLFVTNILIDGMKDLPKRKAVTMDILKIKSLIAE